MFMVLLIFAIAQGNLRIGATKPILLVSGSPRGRGGGFVRAWAWFVIIV